ncbi:unnamed protein product [marine sediment metagenome]|uniref:Methyltransferase FkbM domain-containing protein n=1 Tax=marine sediment metagenome TaxID=412755 RepID=X1MPD2_9ZZZZ
MCAALGEQPAPCLHCDKGLLRTNEDEKVQVDPIYRYVTKLPKPIKKLLRLVTDRYFSKRGYPMMGGLAGCRMVGQLPGTFLNYEPAVTQTITRVVQPGWTCVDVGAHVGYFTLLMGKCVGAQGRVVAIEAYPPNAEQLRANARASGLDGRVAVENVAVSDGSSGWVNLFAGRRRSSYEWNIVGHDIDGRATEPEMRVAATSLDALFPSGAWVDL